MRTVLRRGAALLLASFLVLLPACDGGDEDAPPASSPTAPARVETTTPSATASPGATATPTPAGPASTRLQADPARAFQHLRALTSDVGVRASTTEGERRAAEYIRGQLEAAGYRASIEPFDVQVTLGGASDLTLAPDPWKVETTPLGGSPNGSVSGPLVVAGLGRPNELAAVRAAGAVVVVDRGDLTFAEKIRNAQAVGAAAVVIVNNQPGGFRGDLGNERVRIPAIAAPQEARGVLAQAAANGRTEATVRVDTSRISGKSQNVVGKPSDAPCTAYMGGHYDSVPAGPGANDNASGTALLIELARARRLEGLCIIAFGSEEAGLLGSRAYVEAHNVRGARFMLNFDMVAKFTRPFFLGDDRLTSIATAAASRLGHSIGKGSFGGGLGSDHATFIAAGVPALMFYSGDDNFIHTPQDNISNVSQADLAKYLEIAVAVVDELMPA